VIQLRFDPELGNYGTRLSHEELVSVVAKSNASVAGERQSLLALACRVSSSFRISEHCA
jgi:hypothetical protein